VLDFYCAQHKLVVEVDGSVHREPAQVVRDAARTERLEAYGYRVIRFTNDEVFGDLERVLEEILAVVEAP
jgi:very-short-patch-repair endonuclease